MSPPSRTGATTGTPRGDRPGEPAGRATWVIGDIHGCWWTLQQLLCAISWRPEGDRLVLVGDLVNKGPGSLEVLRWARRHAEAVDVVLGNHDLHLLAVAAGVGRAGRGDRFGEVLSAPDRDQLLDWLRTRCFAVSVSDVLVVHAGVWPTWTPVRALEAAGELERALAGPGWRQLLAALYRGGVRQWRDELVGGARECAAASVLTRLRMLSGDGRARYAFTGAPEDAPEGWWPWYERSPIPGSGTTVVFGHWARLGHRRLEGAICLDSGCAYGGALTALRVHDHHVVQQPAVAAELLKRGR